MNNTWSFSWSRGHTSFPGEGGPAALEQPNSPAAPAPCSAGGQEAAARSLRARSLLALHTPLMVPKPPAAPYPACIIHQLTHKHQAILSVPSVPSGWDFGDSGTGVYWGNWGALGCVSPQLMLEVKQHCSRPSPALPGRASNLEHNKPQNNPAKQGAPTPPNALATDPQKGRWRAVSHPNMLHLFSPHVSVPQQGGVPPLCSQPPPQAA